MSFLDDWKEWSTTKKAISVVCACCIGIIIIGMIGGAISPDKNTNNKTDDVEYSHGGGLLFNRIECGEFSVLLPEGFEKGEASAVDPEHEVCLHTDLVEADELYRNMDVSTVPYEGFPDKLVVVDEYTEGDLKVMKGELFYDDDYGSSANYTYAEFEKDGKHFYVTIDLMYDDLDDVNLTHDVQLIKGLKQSVEFK